MFLPAAPNPEQGFLHWFFDYLLKVLETGAGWPIAVLLIAYWFKKEIAAFLGRTTKATMGSVQFEAAPQSPEAQENAVVDVEELRKKYDAASSEAETLRGANESVSKAFLKVRSENEELKMKLEYEKVYNIMYGSQLQLLKEMVGSPTGLSHQYVETYYSNNQRAHQYLQNYPLEKYLGFLLELGYVKKTVSDYYILSETGKSFVKYVLENIPVPKLPW